MRSKRYMFKDFDRISNSARTPESPLWGRFDQEVPVCGPFFWALRGGFVCGLLFPASVRCLVCRLLVLSSKNVLTFAKKKNPQKMIFELLHGCGMTNVNISPTLLVLSEIISFRPDNSFWTCTSFCTFCRSNKNSMTGLLQWPLKRYCCSLE